MSVPGRRQSTSYFEANVESLEKCRLRINSMDCLCSLCRVTDSFLDSCSGSGDRRSLLSGYKYH